LEDVKAEGGRKARGNSAMLQELAYDRDHIDEQHHLEQMNLKQELAANNWQLAELRMAEAKAEDKSDVLTRHIAPLGNTKHSKHDELDMLESKIEHVHHTLNIKAEDFDQKMYMVQRAMQAEQDAGAAWDVAKQAHQQQADALRRAIRQEKELSARLEQQADRPQVTGRPSTAGRTSRFMPPAQNDLGRTSMYNVVGAPPARPSTAGRTSRHSRPTNSPSAAPARPSTAGSVMRPTRQSQQLADPAQDLTRPDRISGFLSTNQAASVSALYSGTLHNNMQGMETMDPTTMRHALRLLR